MRKKFLCAGGIMILVVMIALIVHSPTTDHRVSADAVKVSYSAPIKSQQSAASESPLDDWFGSVSSTNTTSKSILVGFVAVESWSGKQWTNYPHRYFFQTITPHGTALMTAELSTLPPPGHWRFRMRVAEELTGGERRMRAARWYVQKLADRLRGRTARFPTNPFATNTIYWGHTRDAVFSQEFD